MGIRRMTSLLSSALINKGFDVISLLFALAKIDALTLKSGAEFINIALIYLEKCGVIHTPKIHLNGATAIISNFLRCSSKNSSC